MTASSPRTPDRGLDPALLRAVARGVLARGLLGAADLDEPRLPSVVGRYQVLRTIGRGAGGQVLRAHDPVLGRDVAVKVLERLAPDRVERFRQEIRTLARLRHPGIVAIHDAGVLDDGRPWFVMELVEHPSMRDRWPAREEALDVLAAVADACHAAHQARVVHLDLKPSNILVGPRPVIVDFGIAAATGEQASARVGTPEYMAPEQVSGGAVGPWTDVHALGALLYEVLTGFGPFEGGSVDDVMRRVVEARPRPPRELDPSISPRLEAVALRALAKAPRRRFASAADFSFALRAARGTGGARRAERPAAWSLALAAVSLAALTVAAVLVSRPPEPPPGPASAAEATPPQVEPPAAPPASEAPPPATRHDDPAPPPARDPRPRPPDDDPRFGLPDDPRFGPPDRRPPPPDDPRFGPPDRRPPPPDGRRPPPPHHRPPPPDGRHPPGPGPDPRHPPPPPPGPR